MTVADSVEADADPKFQDSRISGSYIR